MDVQAARAGALSAVSRLVSRLAIGQLRFPGMGGMARRLALNQLLVTMDGIDNPPFMKRFSRTGSTRSSDAHLHRPSARVRAVLAAPAGRRGSRPGDQIYFIGATNVPLERLDPALIRPGRMGRHVCFRTPTKEDRKDIFDLYLDEGRARPRPRHARAPRRDRAHHQRLLAGDDRPDLLDGADERAPRGHARTSAGRTSSRR